MAVSGEQGIAGDFHIKQTEAGGGAGSSDFNHCNSGMFHQHCTHFRQPQWVEVTEKGLMALFPSTSSKGAHGQNKHNQSSYRARVLATIQFTLCPWYSSLPGENRTILIEFIYDSFTVSSFALSTFFFQPSLGRKWL